MSEKLTTKQYWENYYKNDHTTREHVVTVCSQFDKYWDCLVNKQNKSQTIIEIGGYPGRYLAYLAEKYDLQPTCLDFNTDETQIRRTFESMGISNFQILEKDFLKYTPESTYDYVISIGFIEHFENFDEVLDKHVSYLKPGGRLYIMIPNKRYFRKLYGYLVDYKNLKAHNLKCMSLKTFKDFAERNSLKIDTLEYYGGFPFSVHQELNFFQKVIYKLTRLLFKFKINPYLEKHPSKYLSSSIIGIYEKPILKVNP